MIESTHLALDCLYGGAPVTESVASALYDNGVLALLAHRNSSVLRARLHRQIASIERIKQDFLEAAGLLARHEIPFLSIKGVLLAQVLYGDYALRGFEDIDLAIPRERYEETVDLFRSHGYDHRTGDYRDTSVEVFTCVRNHSTLEAHFTISTADRFGDFYRDLWRNPATVQFEGGSFLVPAREKYLVFLLIHLIRHLDAPRAIWFEDIRRVLDQSGPDLDWTVIVDTAALHKLANAMSIGMDLCDRVFGCYRLEVGFPRQVRASIERMRSLHGRLLYRYLLRRLESADTTPFLRRLHSFGISENWGDRLRMMRDFLRINMPRF